MLIDEILDRYDGYKYNPEQLQEYCEKWTDSELYQGVAKALKERNEDMVKRLMVRYIAIEYNLNIINFVLSVNWCKRN